MDGKIEKYPHHSGLTHPLTPTSDALRTFYCNNLMESGSSSPNNIRTPHPSVHSYALNYFGTNNYPFPFQQSLSNIALSYPSPYFTHPFYSPYHNPYLSSYYSNLTAEASSSYRPAIPPVNERTSPYWQNSSYESYNSIFDYGTGLYRLYSSGISSPSQASLPPFSPNSQQLSAASTSSSFLQTATTGAYPLNQTQGISDSNLDANKYNAMAIKSEHIRRDSETPESTENCYIKEEPYEPAFMSYNKMKPCRIDMDNKKIWPEYSNINHGHIELNVSPQLPTAAITDFTAPKAKGSINKHSVRVKPFHKIQATESKMESNVTSNKDDLLKLSQDCKVFKEERKSSAIRRMEDVDSDTKNYPNSDVPFQNNTEKTPDYNKMNTQRFKPTRMQVPVGIAVARQRGHKTQQSKTCEKKVAEIIEDSSLSLRYNDLHSQNIYSITCNAKIKDITETDESKNNIIETKPNDSKLQYLFQPEKSSIQLNMQSNSPNISVPEARILQNTDLYPNHKTKCDDVLNENKTQEQTSKTVDLMEQATQACMSDEENEINIKNNIDIDQMKICCVTSAVQVNMDETEDESKGTKKSCRFEHENFLELNNGFMAAKNTQIMQINDHRGLDLLVDSIKETEQKTISNSQEDVFADGLNLLCTLAEQRSLEERRRHSTDNVSSKQVNNDKMEQSKEPGRRQRSESCVSSLQSLDESQQAIKRNGRNCGKKRKFSGSNNKRQQTNTFDPWQLRRSERIFLNEALQCTPKSQTKEKIEINNNNAQNKKDLNSNTKKHELVSSTNKSGNKIADENEKSNDLPKCSIETMNIEELDKKDLTTSCQLTINDLSGDVRVIIEVDNYLYAGVVSALQAPDVYGVTLDGERAHRPHLYAQEDILKEAIREIKPSPNDIIKDGTRICAYWSQQYRCLYPGKATRCLYQDSLLSFVFVEFDDGDRGKIPLDDIRILPKHYGQDDGEDENSQANGKKSNINSLIDEENAFNLKTHSLKPNEENNVTCLSVDVDEKTNNDDTSKESENQIVEASKKKKKHSKEDKKSKHYHKHHHCKHHKKHKKHKKKNEIEEIERSHSPSMKIVKEKKKKSAKVQCNKKFEIVRAHGFNKKGLINKKMKKELIGESQKRKKEAKSVEKSKIAAFLPDRQIWHWASKSFRKSPAKGKGKKEFYKEIIRGKESIRVGDSAVFLSTGRPNLPYIGKLDSMWQSWGGNMVVKVRWFYHPEETEGDPLRLVDTRGALFESCHFDENDVQTISHKCHVLSWDEYRQRKKEMPFLLFDDPPNIYYLAGTYEPLLGKIQMSSGVPLKEEECE